MINPTLNLQNLASRYVPDSSPTCSVVIASHRLSEALLSSLRSALEALNRADQPGHGRGECVVVLDGLGSTAAERLTIELAAWAPRLQIECVPAGGLTRALIHGCQVAQGRFIARLDAGDTMAPDRILLQIQSMEADPEAVLCASEVQVCGPEWEPLWIDRGTGEAIDVPHHASVMFRRDIYESVGGYRNAFYYGQDWDLWYRLQERGHFLLLHQPLTRVRLQVDGISSRHRREQVAIARLSLACQQARLRGESEQPLLEQAARIRPVLAEPDAPASRSLQLYSPWDARRADGAYFIAEALRRNGDPSCRAYFREALRHGFWKPRIWLRTLQSMAMRTHSRA